MDNKPNFWTYASTAIILILCGAWAYNDYSLEPEKIPFEPIIACLGGVFVLMGYVFFRKKTVSADAEHTISQEDAESPPEPKHNSTSLKVAQKAKKIYNINQIDKADFS